MATLTATAAQPHIATKFIPSGVFSIYTDFTATVFSGDLLQMVKVPSGFRVINTKLYTSTSARSACVVNIHLGDDSVTSRFSAHNLSASPTTNVQSTRDFGVGIDSASSTTLFKKYLRDRIINCKINNFTGSATAAGIVIRFSLLVTGSVDNE